MLQRQASPRSTDAQRIIDAAIDLVIAQGFRKLTLRDLAQAVGKSTTVIVNLFGAKSGPADCKKHTPPGHARRGPEPRPRVPRR